MKGIPDKIATKQDVINICESVEPQRALIVLKALTDADLKRLKITKAEFNKRKSALNERVRENQRALRSKIAGVREAEQALDAVERAIRAVEVTIGGLKDLCREKQEELGQVHKLAAGIDDMIVKAAGTAVALANIRADQEALEEKLAGWRSTILGQQTKIKQDIDRMNEELTRKGDELRDMRQELGRKKEKHDRLSKALSCIQGA